MAKLIFNAEDVKRVVEHSLAAPEQRNVAYRDEQPVAKAVLLVHDQGIYLMSNGLPVDPLDPKQDTTQQYFPCFCAYAKGCHPKNDEDWWERARELVGGDDFGQTLPWAEQMKAMLDRGATHIIINFGKRTMSLSARGMRT
jgi:hypothetical protein